MKERIIGVLIVLLLALSSFALAESSGCNFFCQIGEWWNDFRGENVAGKAVELRIIFNNPDDQKFYETRLGKSPEAVYAFSS